MEPLFERVGLLYRAKQPSSSRPQRQAAPKADPPTHVLRVVDTTGQEDEYDVDVWANDDADAWQRARQLSRWVAPPARVRLHRFGVGVSMGGIRGTLERAS